MDENPPVTFVRFIAAWRRFPKNGSPFLSINVAAVGDLARRFPSEKFALSIKLNKDKESLEAKDPLEDFMERLDNWSKDHKTPVKLVEQVKLEFDPKTGKAVETHYWVAKADGVLHLGIALDEEPSVKAPENGTDKSMVTLKGVIVAVELRPRSRSSRLNF